MNGDRLDEILDRLERLERRLDGEGSFEPRRPWRGMHWQGGRPRWGDGGGFGRERGGGPGRHHHEHGCPGCACRFDEKRVVDKIVELVTERLEQVLDILPQLLRQEPRREHSHEHPESRPHDG